MAPPESPAPAAAEAVGGPGALAAWLPLRRGPVDGKAGVAAYAELLPGLDEDDEYETLPPSAGVATHMTAGALAGFVEHTVVFPVDVVKTRLQRLNPPEGARYEGLKHAIKTMVRTEGYSVFYRGIGAVTLGAGPAHALYFGSYEQIKVLAGARHNENNFAATGIAAIGATFAHDSFLVPCEAVKQRMQVYGSQHRSTYGCIRSTYATEGLGVLWRSFGTQLLTNIPFQCTHFITYETVKQKINPDGVYDPKTHFVAGACGGGLAAALTNPLDVAKTLLNTQEPCPMGRAAQDQKTTERQRIVGTWNAVKTIYRVSGMRGFKKGMNARVIINAPASAISWLVYEFFKHSLPLLDHDGSGAVPCLADESAAVALSTKPAPATAATAAALHAASSTS